MLTIVSWFNVWTFFLENIKRTGFEIMLLAARMYERLGQYFRAAFWGKDSQSSFVSTGYN